jgi:hypothetical protein
MAYRDRWLSAALAGFGMLAVLVAMCTSGIDSTRYWTEPVILGIYAWAFVAFVAAAGARRRAAWTLWLVLVLALGTAAAMVVLVAARPTGAAWVVSGGLAICTIALAALARIWTRRRALPS